MYRSALRRLRKNVAHLSGLAVAVAVFLVGVYYFGVSQPPVFFPLETIVTIPEGATLREAAEILKEEQVVRSSLALQALVLAQPRTHVLAGDYYFTERLGLQEVVTRVTTGAFGLTPVRVTIPEGATTYQMVEVLADRLDAFDSVQFALLTQDKEGYLYPDTYLFLPNATTRDVVEELERNFYERVRALEQDIAAFGRPVHEVVTMASLLEKEAYKYDDKREIAGVLWNRLAIDMPLQVDAVFGFIERTETFSPLYSDLEVESPYNTYRNRGLPPGPIGSPSIESIEAAISPVPTDALFYLHGRDGVLRLAQTYDEHLSNRWRYLD
jgi:UPF0755 protein